MRNLIVFETLHDDLCSYRIIMKVDIVAGYNKSRLCIRHCCVLIYITKTMYRSFYRRATRLWL